MADETPKNEQGRLKRLTQAALDSLIDQHENYTTGRKGGKRADFSFHDLAGLSFAGRNLSDANFTGAALSEANFRDAILERANFFCADLRFTMMNGANLTSADLRGASLRGSTMIGANMAKVDLREGSLARASNNASDEGELKAAHSNLTVAD